MAAAVFAPVAPEDSYEAVIDVRGFPAWEPGVRRVEVLSGEGGPGCSPSGRSRSSVSARGSSACWRRRSSRPGCAGTYDGPVEGWGE